MGKIIKNEMKPLFGFFWSWFSIIALAGYYFIAMAIVEITLKWRYCALIVVIAALLSFFIARWEIRWESRQ